MKLKSLLIMVLAIAGSVVAQDTNPGALGTLEDLAAELDRGSGIGLTASGRMTDEAFEATVAQEESQEALRLIRDWEAREDRPTIREDGGRLEFTHGRGIPLLIAKPLQLTDLELQPGERIAAVHTGDQSRWTITPSVSGIGEEETTHIIIKPTAPNLSTSLVINTDRRTYHLRLVSSFVHHMPYVGFEYPNDRGVDEWAAYAEMSARRKVERESAATTALGSEERELLQQLLEEREARLAAEAAEPEPHLVEMWPGRDSDVLDFEYTIRRVKGTPPWTPELVYHNGVKTVIVMPKKMRTTEAPILLVVDGNQRNMVNYRVTGGRYVVDQLFNRAVLVAGVGRDRQEVEIRKR